MRVNKYEDILESVNGSIGFNEEFQTSDLRNAFYIIDNVSKCLYNRNLTRKQADDIIDRVDNIIRKKLLKLDPTLSLEFLNKICTCYKMGRLGIPVDISIIDNAVFCLFAIEGEGTAIDSTEVFLLSGYKGDDFKEVNNEDSSFTSNVWDDNFNIDIAFGKNPIFNYFDESKTSCLVSRIVDYINKMLEPIFLSQIIYAGTDFNSDGYYYGNDTVFYASERVKIFSSLNLPQLMEAIYFGKDISFKLIVVDDWNEFFGFDIKQTVHDDKSFTWDWDFYVPELWNLESIAYKAKNNKHLVREK